MKKFIPPKKTDIKAVHLLAVDCEVILDNLNFEIKETLDMHSIPQKPVSSISSQVNGDVICFLIPTYYLKALIPRETFD